MGGPELAYLLYRAGAALASAAPEAVAVAAGEAAGVVVGRLAARRREVVRRNLSRVVGPEELEACVDRAFRSYARYWVETLRLPRPGPEALAARTAVEGLERAEAVRGGGRGLIFVTAHLGNWDLAGAWLAARGWPVVAVAEELSPPPLYELFVRLRRRAGMEVLPAGRASTARALLSTLRRGGVVALVADRDISGTGVEVDLFGEPTFLPSGPAVLALRTGAAIVAGALYHRPRGRFYGVVLEPIVVERSRGSLDEVAGLTRRVARDLETLIRRDPGQWHMFQPAWPSDPGYRRGASAAPGPPAGGR